MLTRLGYRFHDLGTFSTEPVDYPDVALAVARAVRGGEARLGILVDGAGIGSAMAANKVPGVRAAPCADDAAARNAREHNDANVLTLGATLRRRAACGRDRGDVPRPRLHRGAARAARREDQGHRETPTCGQ